MIVFLVDEALYIAYYDDKMQVRAEFYYTTWSPRWTTSVWSEIFSDINKYIQRTINSYYITPADIAVEANIEILHIDEDLYEEVYNIPICAAWIDSQPEQSPED